MPKLAPVLQGEMADILGITTRTLRTLSAPRRKDGRYVVASVVQWYVEYVREQERAKAPKHSPEVLTAMDRFRAARAEREEIATARVKRTVVDVVRVREDWLTQLTWFKNALLAIPNALAPTLTGLNTPQIYEVLQDRLREVLDHLATGDPSESTR